MVLDLTLLYAKFQSTTDVDAQLADFETFIDEYGTLLIVGSAVFLCLIILIVNSVNARKASKRKEKIERLDKELTSVKGELDKVKKQKDDLMEKYTLLQEEKSKNEERVKEIEKQSSKNMSPEGRQKLDELELNIAKIEKLQKLKSMNVLSNDEYDDLKKKILDSIKN